MFRKQSLRNLPENRKRLKTERKNNKSSRKDKEQKCSKELYQRKIQKNSSELLLVWLSGLSASL